MSPPETLLHFRCAHPARWPITAPAQAYSPQSSRALERMAHCDMDALAEHRLALAQRRFRCDLHQAALHATTEEAEDLKRLVRAWRLGGLTLEDAQRHVDGLRALIRERQAA